LYHAKARRREGREKENFLRIFFAALRLCVIKNARYGCARPHLAAICDKNGLSGHDNIADILIYPNLTKALCAFTVEFQWYDMMDIISVIARGMLVNCPNKGGAVTSPMIEKILEYRFLADLTSALWVDDIPCDVMRSDVDHHGYDLAIEANGILRHIQLKGKTHGAETNEWHFNVNLWKRGSGCIVILEHKDKCSEISDIRFLGGDPGQRLTDFFPLLTDKRQEKHLSEGEKPSKKVTLKEGKIPQLDPQLTGNGKELVKKLVLKLFGEPQHRSS
jgi:hypothetical protein